jgi:hypothetical protein
LPGREALRDWNSGRFDGTQFAEQTLMRSFFSMVLISTLAGCGSAAPLVERQDASMNEVADASSTNEVADATSTSEVADATSTNGAADTAPAADGAADAADDVRPSGCCAMPPPRTEVASIRVTASSNSRQVDVAVFSDASAERTIGPARSDPPTGLPQDPASFPPGAPEVVAFLRDLAAVGDVSAIPADPGLLPFPTHQGCAKSASGYTVMTVTAGGKTSGDLECLDSPAAASATALANDAFVLVGTL